MLSNSLNNVFSLHQIALAYGGRSAYEQEIQRSLTKLNYEQWLIVRTEKFIDWFGDWQGLMAQGKLDTLPPIAVRFPERLHGLNLEKLRAQMVTYLDLLSTTRAKATHPDLGPIGFNTRGRKKTNRYSADRAKILTILDILPVLRQSIYVRSDVPKPNTKDKNIRGVSILLAPVIVEEVSLIARFVIHRKQDGHWYYDSVLLLKKSSSEVRVSNRRPDRGSGSGDAPILTSLGKFEHKEWRGVKSDSVSKEVSPETGEPLETAIERFVAQYAV